MKAEQDIQYEQDANAAVLFVHGILGTPDHFKPFLSLVPPGCTVYSILLKGHGGSVKEFSAASMAEWRQQVHDSLQTLLAAHSRVIIAAHSMGTLFAIQEAICCPSVILFLMNPPLKLRLRFKLLKTTWRVFRGNIKPDDEWSLAARNAYGIERDTHILRYLGWVPRYLELFREIRKTRKLMHKLSARCHAYLSLQDEMISPKSAGFFERNPNADVKILNSSGHYYYSLEDLQLLRNGFRAAVETATHCSHT